MDDFEVRHTPAPIAHIARHDAKAFRFELTTVLSDARVFYTIQESGKHQPIAVQVCPDEQDSSADCIQLDEIAFIPQVV